MLEGIEIALALYGLFGLVGGALIISKSKVVRGRWARLLGGLALVPLVASFALIFLPTKDPAFPRLIETGVVVTVAVAVFTAGALLGVNADAAEPAPEDGWEESGGYDGSAAGGELDPGAGAAELELDIDGGPPGTGPGSENLDYVDDMAEPHEPFEMNPEQPDYFDTKAARSGDPDGDPDPLGDVGPAEPDAGPPRPGSRTSFN